MESMENLQRIYRDTTLIERTGTGKSWGGFFDHPTKFSHSIWILKRSRVFLKKREKNLKRC